MNPEIQAVRNYAEALFACAKEQGLVAQLLEEARDLRAILVDVPGLRTYVECPSVPTEDVEGLVKRTLVGRFSPLLTNYILLLLRKHRTPILGDSLDWFATLAERDQGFSHGEVRSAVPLDDAQRSRLKAGLESRTGLRLNLDYKIDPAIKGGIVFQSGDLLIDNSLSHQLDRLRSTLMSVKVI